MPADTPEPLFCEARYLLEQFADEAHQAAVELAEALQSMIDSEGTPQ